MILGLIRPDEREQTSMFVCNVINFIWKKKKVEEIDYELVSDFAGVALSNSG